MACDFSRAAKYQIKLRSYSYSCREMNQKRSSSFDGTLESGYSIILLLPTVVTCTTSKECVAVFNAALPKNIDFFVKFLSVQKSTLVRADRVNDTTIKFQTPANFPPGAAKITIHHTANQNMLCRYHRDFHFESKLEIVHDLLKSVSDPVSFIADSLNIGKNDGVAVDFKLEKIFKNNKPMNFDLLRSNEAKVLPTNETKKTRNPTLLHFAARHNLVRLCLALVDTPGGKEALNLQNLDGHFPHNLAEQCQNGSLSKLLREAKDSATKSNRSSGCADEIYEQMSPEIFKHYIEVKKTFKRGGSVKQQNTSNRNSSEEDTISLGGGGGGVDNDDDDDDDDDDYDEVYEHMSESGSPKKNSINSRMKLGIPEAMRSCSVPDIGRGLALHGLSQQDMTNKRSNPLLEELRRKNEGKKGIPGGVTSPVTPPPRPQKPLPKRSNSLEDTNENTPLPSARMLHASTSCLETTNEIYDTPPARPNRLTQSASADDLYDYPPTQYDNNNNADDVYDFPPPRKTPLPSPSVEQKSGFDIYDTPVAKSMENTLYVPASSFEKGNAVEDTYDVLPTRLPTDLASLRAIEPEAGFETYDVLPSQKEESADNELYDVPVKLNGTSSPLRNSTSNQDLTQTQSRPPFSFGNRALAFDMGRTGKRHSEPVLPAFSNVDKKKLLRGQQAAIQRSHMPLPAPPRNANIQPRSPKPGRRPMVPPPLPPQRVPKR